MIGAIALTAPAQKSSNRREKFYTKSPFLDRMPRFWKESVEKDYSENVQLSLKEVQRIDNLWASTHTPDLNVGTKK